MTLTWMFMKEFYQFHVEIMLEAHLTKRLFSNNYRDCKS